MSTIDAALTILASGIITAATSLVPADFLLALLVLLGWWQAVRAGPAPTSRTRA